MNDDIELNHKNADITPQKENNTNTKKRQGWGSWKGQIKMSDDFNEPLEEMQEYM